MSITPSRGSVLVIDDEYGVRTGIRKILALEGYDVVEAATGHEALAALDRLVFDVALIDYRLPDVDGLTLLQGIRTRGLPTMTCMITAYANIDMAIAATRQGIDFFLPKPFSPEDLLGVLETLLRHKRVREEAEALRRAHEASLLDLASEKSRTHHLVASLRDAVLVVNRAGEVALLNGAMARLLGRPVETAAACAGRPAAELLGADRLAPLRALLAAAEGPDRAVRELELGDRTYVAAVVAFREDGRGREEGPGGAADATHPTDAPEAPPPGRILTLADVTELRRAALEKSRLVRTMVHEIRSPLGAIRSMLEVVRDRSLGDDPAAYDEFLDRSMHRIDKLVELVGELLSLSRIDARAAEPAPSAAPTLLAPTLLSVTDLFREPAQARGIELRTDLAPDLAVALATDDLQTILTNLVGNAVKYNRDGGRVEVNARRVDHEVTIRVSDTGIGVRAENLPRLFDEFFREKRAETRDIEGNGLGLAIVKRLVERATGHIEVTSQPGLGTTFTLRLPARG
jgi:two-component system phosphate regulon sensor histidine kinase PhoR